MNICTNHTRRHSWATNRIARNSWMIKHCSVGLSDWLQHSSQGYLPPPAFIASGIIQFGRNKREIRKSLRRQSCFAVLEPLCCILESLPARARSISHETRAGALSASLGSVVLAGTGAQVAIVTALKLVLVCGFKLVRSKYEQCSSV
ncbi:hypothetical protein RRG08_019039 [Elysia crispata]|uniref:Uncharacterized protein n=1 Tax=Elysia crispata TaxID=231223 RepID=A0AAE1A5N9_9GAST|nr:hypothetical protein RRG08_019039 [Elysia crispata]